MQTIFGCEQAIAQSTAVLITGQSKVIAPVGDGIEQAVSVLFNGFL